ncbi:MAG: hypothetical protein AAFY72_06740 [Cyanobacteria bacterium J06649_4]
MAHIVCITGGLTSRLNVSLALVERLEQAGHRITYASPGDLRAKVTAQGIDYVQLAPWVIQSVDDVGTDGKPMTRWEKLWRLRSRQQKAVEALGVQHFADTMRSLQPDLLLIDIEMHPHIMAAVSAGFPVALICSFLSIWRRPNLPPIHTDILPGQSWRGQPYGIQWAWLRYSWQKWKEFQRDRWQRMGLDRISVLRYYAKQLNYPFRSRFGLTQWIVPYPHGPLPILCCNALELDFPHDPHPSMYYVGAMVQQNRQETQLPEQDVWRLQRLLNTHAAAKDSVRQDSADRDRTRKDRSQRQRSLNTRTLIYCGCSSMVKGDSQRLKRIIEAVHDCETWDLVLGLGGQLTPDQLGTLPPNVYAFRWAPQLKILEYADCAIVDAGSSAVRECVAAGVPMLIYSYGSNDQNGNRARVVYHGLGIGGDPPLEGLRHRRKDSASQIRHHIERLLTDKTYQIQVEAMRDRLQQYDREKRAVTIVESLLPASARTNLVPVRQEVAL